MTKPKQTAPESNEAEKRASDSLQRMVRPVRCYFCNEPMHYVGQPGHVPEVWVVYGDPSSDFHAHLACWNQRVACTAYAQTHPREGKT